VEPNPISQGRAVPEEVVGVGERSDLGAQHEVAQGEELAGGVVGDVGDRIAWRGAPTTAPRQAF